MIKNSEKIFKDFEHGLTPSWQAGGVVHHLRGVGDAAGKIAVALGVNPDFSKKIGLLHDIKLPQQADAGRSHALLGFDYFKKYDYRLAKVVARHMTPIDLDFWRMHENHIFKNVLFSRTADYERIYNMIRNNDITDLDLIQHVADFVVVSEEKGYRFSTMEARRDEMLARGRDPYDAGLKLVLKEKLDTRIRKRGGGGVYEVLGISK